MRIALMADLHANREAFEACLSHAGERGVDRFVFLGDYVNYGADPEWTVATLARRVEEGAIALLGNHDAAAAGGPSGMTPAAEAALEWTRGRLGADERRFLGGLPLRHAEADALFVHADAAAPAKWGYIRDKADAFRALEAVSEPLVVCGHVHVPAVYTLSPAWKTTIFGPLDAVPIPLLPRRRWLAVLGSVGQPRDGIPAASYAILDTDALEITYFRVPYDVETAAGKLRAAGLPEILEIRLRGGR